MGPPLRDGALRCALRLPVHRRALIRCAVTCALVAISLDGSGEPSPSIYPAVVVNFPAPRIPRFLWARELVWLSNMGIRSISSAGATPEFRSIAKQAGIEVVEPEAHAVTVSATTPNVIERSRAALQARRQIVWRDVESEVAPVFHQGAVSFQGDEDTATQTLRREAAVSEYWEPVLDGHETPAHSQITGLASAEQRFATRGMVTQASALGLINTKAAAWRGVVAADLPSFGRRIQIPNVTVPAHDALMLPVDVSFSDQRFCRLCSGMGNAERLLYATAELEGIEYENGILTFDFYAPVAGVALLQLSREPEGPMLAGGRPLPFDWDPESKRARLPIPAGKAPGKTVRVALAISAPDMVASFLSPRVLIAGEVNHVVADFSPAEVASRSRLVTPEAWTISTTLSDSKATYDLTVPELLHGLKRDLRLETDGASVSHVRVQVLRPVSVHVAEAMAVHFGRTAELTSDPPLIPCEAPRGKNISVELKNNAREPRSFHVALSGTDLDFSPASVDVALEGTGERAISFRVFAANGPAVLRDAQVQISGSAAYNLPLRFVVMGRGADVSYQADVLGTGQDQAIWENSRIRAVFSRPDGGHWIEFYWKPSGTSLLSPEGFAIGNAAKIDLSGNELTISEAEALPKGDRVGNIEWKALVSGTKTRYRVSEASKTN